MMRLFIFLILPISFISCESYDIRLKIRNSSPHDIYVISYDNSSLKDYPGQMLNMSNEFFPKDTLDHLSRFGGRGNAWPRYVKNAPNKKLYLYVIPSDTVDFYPKDTIVKYKKYYKVLSFSLKELEEIGWKVEIE